MAKMRLKPLGDKVIIERSKAETKTSGGIVLPDNAKEKPKQGEIKAVGPGSISERGERMTMQVAKGDKVLFTAYAGTEVTIDDIDYLIMSESDILAIIE